MSWGVVSQVACRVCFDLSAESFISRLGFDHRRCSSCGAIFVSNVPSDSEIRDLYQHEKGYSIPHDHRPVGRSVWEEVSDKLKPGSVRRILDVGCGAGYFLSTLPGFLQKYGCDINSGDIKLAREEGLNLVAEGPLEEQSYPNDFFDLVHLGDVIEHVEEPNSLFQEVTRVLREGGYVTISTPDMDSFWSKGTFFIYKYFGIAPSVLCPPPPPEPTVGRGGGGGGGGGTGGGVGAGGGGGED